MNTRHLWLLGAALCCVAVSVAAQAPQKYSVERKVNFEPGTAPMTQGLRNFEPVREIVSAGYMIAAEDLNDDKYPEIIVLASSPEFCGSAGCRMVVLRYAGPARFEEIGRHFASPDVGVLRETENGYRLLATLDDKGAVALVDKTPLVRAMGTDAATETAQATAPAAVHAAPPKLPATVANDLKAIADECNSFGAKAMTDDAVRLADLNGDGRDDYVLFVGWIGCQGAASIYGDREKEVRVYASDGAGGASKAFAGIGAFDARIEGSGTTAKLWLTVTATACGKKQTASFAERSWCERPIAWNAKTGKFDFAPVSSVRMLTDYE